MISRKEKKTIADKIRLILSVTKKNHFSIDVKKKHETTKREDYDTYKLYFDKNDRLVIKRLFLGYRYYRVTFKQFIENSQFHEDEEETILDLIIFLDQELIERV